MSYYVIDGVVVSVDEASSDDVREMTKDLHS